MGNLVWQHTKHSQSFINAKLAENAKLRIPTAIFNAIKMHRQHQMKKNHTDPSVRGLDISLESLTPSFSKQEVLSCDPTLKRVRRGNPSLRINDKRCSRKSIQCILFYRPAHKNQYRLQIQSIPVTQIKRPRTRNRTVA